MTILSSSNGEGSNHIQQVEASISDSIKRLRIGAYLMESFIFRYSAGDIERTERNAGSAAGVGTNDGATDGGGEGGFDGGGEREGREERDDREVWEEREEWREGGVGTWRRDLRSCILERFSCSCSWAWVSWRVIMEFMRADSLVVRFDFGDDLGVDVGVETWDSIEDRDFCEFWVFWELNRSDTLELSSLFETDIC